ncbi:MAG: BolA family transcriptional regulator [Polyangiaceae bacterium]|nr:BolA family transcriptional regulator [Polyangiaceae bacterium]
MILQKRIVEKLTQGLAPLFLDVVNESHMHSVAPGSETHFKVLVVSPSFEGKSLVDRHRTVNGLLTEEFRDGLHALSIRALTPPQWETSGAANFKSPPCLGGSKADAKA